nr:MAG TPA: hypothetical protein [Caudoviricetes sp.]
MESFQGKLIIKGKLSCPLFFLLILSINNLLILLI